MPQVRNQQLLAEIKAREAEITPEQRLDFRIKGMEETIQGNLRQYGEMLDERFSYEKALADAIQRANHQTTDRDNTPVR